MLRQPSTHIDLAVQQILQAGETVQWSGRAAPQSMVSFQNIATGLSLIFDLVIIGVLWWMKVVEPWLLLIIGAGLIGMTLLSALLRKGFSKVKPTGLYLITNRRLLEIMPSPMNINGIAIMPEAIETVRILAGKTPTSGTIEIQASQHAQLANPEMPQGRTTRIWNNIDNVQTVQMQIEALRSASPRSFF